MSLPPNRVLNAFSYAAFGVDCIRASSATSDYGPGGVVRTESRASGLATLAAILRFSRRHWSKVAALLATLTCGLGSGLVFAQTPQGQSSPERRTFGDVRDCPPGHRIEFILPATTIYVDPRWLGSSTIIDLKNQGGPACPTGPVKRNGIELGYGILRAMDVHRGIGAGLMRFDVGGNPNESRFLAPGQSDSDAKPHRSGPWIEDDTMLKNVPNARGYLIHYPAVNGLDRPVRISCGGGEAITGASHKLLRTCSKGPIAGKDTPFDGIHYTYTLSQTDVPVPPISAEYSTDPASEPGALLEFDSRFRAWFLTLKKKP